tara:strand:- start:441 stop:2333 length:1893 start_codon:yes stop_codon:yes gene_type:complete
MLVRKILYIAYFSLISSPYLLAGSFHERDKKIYNSISFSPNANKSVLIANSEKDTIKTNKEGFLKWSLIESGESLPTKIKWVPIDIKTYPIHDENTNNRNTINLNIFNGKPFDFRLLDLGKAVPTTNTLGQDQLRIEVGQVSTIKEGYAKGTGNQNYKGEINYGFSDDLLFTIFYTDADDPLTKEIGKLDTQPENRWSSYGSAIKWKFFEKSKYQLGLHGSIENWMVQSGGCAGPECSFNSSNIFNSETSMVENNNLVGSISLPIGLKYSSNVDFTISPKLTFLPDSQSNQYGEGDFYGNNYGIGFGMAYKAIDRLKTFTSYYLPLGDSKNSFDDKLNFTKTSIYTLGFNYAIDSRTNFQAFLSNGFGLSPATSVLSIPSSDEILYGFNVIYTPTEFDNYYDEKNEKSSNNKFFNGLSVSNNSYINSENNQLNILYDVNGSWYSTYEKALSQRFIVDITAGVLDKDIVTDSEFRSYFSPGNTIARAGAKAILYSNNKSNEFTSALRGSFGRVLAESKPGYFFGESINSYNFNEKLSFNINPKIGISGTGESIGLGTGVHWKILRKITLISETNIPINNAENNITFGVRYSPEESYKHFDIYSSNAFSFIDMGQLMKRNENSLGVNVGILF